MSSIENLRVQNSLLREYVIGLQHQNESRNKQTVIMQQQIDALQYQLRNKQKIQHITQLTKLKQQIQHLQRQNQKILSESPSNKLIAQLQERQIKLLNLQAQVKTLKKQNSQLKYQINLYDQKTPDDSKDSFYFKNQLAKVTQEKEEILQKNKQLTDQLKNIIKNINTTNNRANDRYTFGNQFPIKKLLTIDIQSNCQHYQTSIQKNIQNSFQNSIMQNSLYQRIQQLQTQLQDTKIRLSALKHQNQYIEDIQKQLQQKNQQIAKLKNQIINFQRETNQYKIQIKKKNEINYQMEKAVIDLNHEINNLKSRYQQIIQSKHNQIHSRGQAFNKKIQMMALQLEKAQAHENSLIQIQNQNKALLNEIQKKQTIINFLKEQNQNILQNTNRKSQIRGILSSQQKYTPPKYQINQNNDNYRYNSPNTKQVITPIKQQSLNLQKMKQNQHLKSVQSGRKIDYLQKHNAHAPLISPPLTNNNFTPIHNYSQTVQFQRNNQDYKRHMQNITLNDNLSSPDNGTLHHNMHSPLQKVSPRKNVFKQIIKPASQLYERQQTINPRSRININVPTSIAGKLVDEKKILSAQDNKIEKWEQVQKRINYLRRQNKDLKKTLFQ